MATKYPDQIDGYSEIRVTRDRIDEVVASDHNDLRSAVVAIEETLGTNPQGIFTTVKDRLEDAYHNIELHVAGLDLRHDDTHIDAAAKSGTNYSLSLGTVSTQLDEVLDNLDDAYAYVGYKSANVTSDVVKETLDNIILSGFDVTFSAYNAAIVGNGTILGNGFVAEWSSAIVNLPSAAGTYYLYVGVDNSGVVHVEAESAGTIPFSLDSGDNRVSVLWKIVHTGVGATDWQSDDDLRRRGRFINNKNYFTVGVGDNSGEDYADFSSLRAAVEYIRGMSALDATINKVTPKKIVLNSDIEITTIYETVWADIDGLEIDGGGHTIYNEIDEYVFSTVNGVNNLTIKNLHFESTLTVSGVPGYIYGGFLIVPGNSNRVIIENCKATMSGNRPLNKFIDLNGGNLVNSIIKNNVVDIMENFMGVNVGGGRFVDCIIEGNIVTSSHSTESGHGVYSCTQCIIANNKFDFFGQAAIGDAIDCYISDNEIKQFYYGISMSNSSNFSYINNNYFEVKEIGIECDDTSNNFINGNYFMASGSDTRHAINDLGSSCVVSNNYIENFGTDGSSIAIKITGAGQTGNIIVGNTIFNPTGTAIYANLSSFTIINDNNIYGDYYGSSTEVGISLVGNYSVVSGNMMSFISVGAYSGFCIGLGSYVDSIVVSNNVLSYFLGTAINVNNADNCVISGNTITGFTSGGGASYGVFYFGQYNCINNNTFSGCGADSGNAIEAGNATGSTINDNTFVNLYGEAINLCGAGNVVVSNNTFSGRTTTKEAIKDLGSECVVNGNFFRAMAREGSADGVVTVDDSMENISIVNNVFEDCNDILVNLNTCDGVIIDGNMFDNASSFTTSSAIYNVGSNTLITNNIFENCGNVSYAEEVIYVSSTAVSNIIISNNIFNDFNYICIDINDKPVSVFNNIMISTGTSDVVLNDIGDGCCFNNNKVTCSSHTTNDLFYMAGISRAYFSFNENVILGCGGGNNLIDFQGADFCNVCNNIFNAISAGGNCLLDIGNYSTVDGNYISGFGESGTGLYGISSGGHHVSVLNNIIDGGSNYNYIIELSTTTGYGYFKVENNILGIGDSIEVQEGGIYVKGAMSSILNNTIVNSGAASTDSSIILSEADYSIASQNTMLLTNGVGIKVYLSDNCIVSENNIREGSSTSVSYGIQLLPGAGSVDNCIVVNNIIQNIGYIGIDNGSNDYNVIMGNYIDGNSNSEEAILDVGSYCLIKNNIIHDFGDGGSNTTCINVDGDNTVVSGNIIDGNSNYDNIIYVDGEKCIISDNLIGTDSVNISNIGINGTSSANYCVFSNNIINSIKSDTVDAYAINSLGSYNVINSNMIYDLNYHGINAKSYSSVCNNFIEDTSGNNDYIGILCASSGLVSTSVLGNTIINVGTGFKADGLSVSRLNISNNNIICTTGTEVDIGINISATGQHSINGNHIYNVDLMGILLDNVTECSVMNNHLQSCDAGIATSSCTKIFINGNQVSRCAVSPAINISGLVLGVLNNNVVYGHNATNHVIWIGPGHFLNILVSGNFIEVGSGSSAFYYTGAASGIKFVGNLVEGGSLPGATEFGSSYVDANTPSLNIHVS